MFTKPALRKLYRERNRLVLAANRKAAGLAAARLFAETTWFQESGTIAAYFPLDDEFDSTPCIETLWAAGKRGYLPVVVSQAERQLIFVHYHQQSRLVPNRYAILEPANQHEAIPLHELDIILMPLIAFDRSGNRLGTGGGFYDKTLAALADKKKKPRLIGLAYAMQEADKLPQEPWDIPLDAVITEKGGVFF